MTLTQQILTIAIMVAATALTRALPFLLFPPGHATPPFVRYLGRVLPLAVFAMLVVYCLRSVDFLTGLRGLPELVGIAATVALHVWRRQMLLSIAGGTIVYMLIVNAVHL